LLNPFEERGCSTRTRCGRVRRPQDLCQNNWRGQDTRSMSAPAQKDETGRPLRRRFAISSQAARRTAVEEAAGRGLRPKVFLIHLQPDVRRLPRDRGEKVRGQGFADRTGPHWISVRRCLRLTCREGPPSGLVRLPWRATPPSSSRAARNEVIEQGSFRPTRSSPSGAGSASVRTLRWQGGGPWGRSSTSDCTGNGRSWRRHDFPSTGTPRCDFRDGYRAAAGP